MTAVFRGYDQATLDRQLNARATVPDFTVFVQRYSVESARCRATLPCHVGVPYGPKPEERLDIFPAQGRGAAPVFIFLHGGYWRLLDAADSSFMAETFTQAGACVVAVNYGLAPDTPLPEIVRQCRAAVAWIVKNIAHYGGDPAHLHVSGSSAGGHLAGMVIAPGWQEDFGIGPRAVRSASPLSGLFDLVPVQLSEVNGWLGMDAATARAMSPQYHLPDWPVPLAIAYGPDETEEFHRQSEAYAAACAARGSPVEMIVPPGTNHFDLPLAFMDRESPLTRAVLRLMGLV
ncbi:MAG: alpha/beta hydrolase [Beijerinckiaceae bacterium]